MKRIVPLLRSSRALTPRIPIRNINNSIPNFQQKDFKLPDLGGFNIDEVNSNKETKTNFEFDLANLFENSKAGVKTSTVDLEMEGFELEKSKPKESNEDLVNEVEGFEYENEHCETSIPVSELEQELEELEESEEFPDLPPTIVDPEMEGFELPGENTENHESVEDPDLEGFELPKENPEREIDFGEFELGRGSQKEGSENTESKEVDFEALDLFKDLSKEQINNINEKEVDIGESSIEKEQSSAFDLLSDPNKETIENKQELNSNGQEETPTIDEDIFAKLFSNLDTSNQQSDLKNEFDFNTGIDLKSQSEAQLDSLLNSMLIDENQPMKQQFPDDPNYSQVQNLLKPSISSGKTLAKFTKEVYDGISDKYGVDTNWIGRVHREKASLASRRITILNLDFNLRQKLYSETGKALEPTFELMNNFKNSEELYEFLISILNQTAKLLKSKTEEQIYLRDIFLDENKDSWCKVHDEVISKIKHSTTTNPRNPLINVLTIPTILNHSLKLLTFKFYNGQLAITLFNLLKQNPQLYNFACNQGTYNEMLRVHWVYFGHLDLRELEKTFMEMLFLGHKGDFMTYHILRVIIDQYDAGRNGNSELFNQDTKLYTRDDNTRINELKKRFHDLRRRLQSVEPVEIKSFFQKRPTTGYFNSDI